jgi:hypothetical protein
MIDEVYFTALSWKFKNLLDFWKGTTLNYKISWHCHILMIVKIKSGYFKSQFFHSLISIKLNKWRYKLLFVKQYVKLNIMFNEKCHKKCLWQLTKVYLNNI